MALSVLERPIGHKINPTPVSATVSDNAGDALFTSASHGLSNQYIYIDSVIESYNGFFFVESGFPTNTFKIRRFGDTEFIKFKQAITLSYYVSGLDHGWQCIHLPIVYELSSDLYPVNSVDTIFAPLFPYTSSPYVNFQLTVGHGLVVLDYVLFKEYPDSIGEVIQVISITNLGATDLILLNKDSAGTDLYSAQKVRKNYHVDVKIYAGLPSGHAWESEKPYELATTLRLVPDSNNIIKFSISSNIKNYVTTRNNLILDTLPNNIDAFTAFYIEYAEGYDVSDGEEITAFLDEFTDDSTEFEGYAVNAMLEFKNMYSGHLSEYLLSTIEPKGKFLTNFETPKLFVNKYFDISFIIPTGLTPPLFLKKVWKYADGSTSNTTETEITDFDEGVYRVALEAQCSNTAVVETTYIDSEWESDVEGWYQGPGSYTDNWGWGNTPDYFGDGSGYVFKPQVNSELPQFNHTISLVAGQSVRLELEFGGLDDGEEYNLQIYVSESLLLASQMGNYTYTKNTGLGQDTLSVDEFITVPEGDTGIYTGVYFVLLGGNNPGNVVYVNYFRITSQETMTRDTTSVDVTVTDNGGSIVYTGEQTINIDCGCKNNSIYMTWLNNFGGFDYWDFDSDHENIREIRQAGEVKTNIFTNWPKSYGADANTIRRQTYRDSNKKILVRSQNLTLDELLGLEYIKSSICVEIVNSRMDKRRVLIDTDSWTSYKQEDKLYTLSFTASYTNDIPSQRL